MFYCIKRNISGTYLSTQGNRPKPAIVVFRNPKNARNIMRFYKECNQNKKQQEMLVEKVNIIELAGMCKNVALDLTIIDDSVVFNLKPGEDYLHVLNKTFTKFNY